ncbi:unnamed protein product [Clavelina lepadiformis]|uniref:Serine-threonine/tyrosine-protein kinase catalytic domain-containing protein n=1 Tax=Clavelina lepadiformis TaxID=159417 RepID=A0ABP0GGR8_CLALP
MATLGAAPYPHMEPNVITQKLNEGYRIPRPTSCSEYIYSIMCDCWSWDAIKRPSFKNLEERLRDSSFDSDKQDMTNLSANVEALKLNDRKVYEDNIGRRDGPLPASNESKVTNQYILDGDIVVDLNN